ncbi:MAG: serine/threonine protein kinase [Olegusella sp.]|nr:serine/threonine protein kinase [Olegusella sp.]
METDDLDRELGSRLDGLDASDGYRVERTLKQSENGLTQLVFLVARDGSELGPFVRKIMHDQRDLGCAYEAVYAAQQRGLRLVHLPRIYKCTHAEGHLTVIMEYVHGSTLDAYIRQLSGADGRLAFVQKEFGDLCDAVSELHECCGQPIIHRDLKPSNIMVTQGGVMLIDLGISRIFKMGAEQDTTHFGTRAYASPEQFGFGQTDVRSDVYSLGMLLFFCLTGREASSQDRASSFTDVDIPSALRAVVVKATRFDPAARYATVRLFKRALILALEADKKQKGIATSPSFASESHSTDLKRIKPASSSSPQRSILSRIPRSLGLVWDVLVAAACVLFVLGCVAAYLVPTPQNASKPAWYMAFSYFFCMIPLIVITSYLILDRRPLRQWIPALANLTVRRETISGIKAIVFIFVIWLAATLMGSYLFK